MPIMPSLLRRRGDTSDPHARRHSYFGGESFDGSPVDRVDGRASEQIPRKGSVPLFVSPSSQSVPGLIEPLMDSPEHLDRSISPPIQAEISKNHRFSLLRFRHASDSQLATRARQQAEAAVTPPVPPPPAIITTGPTEDIQEAQSKKSRRKLPDKSKPATDSKFLSALDPLAEKKKGRRKTMSEAGPPGKGRVDFDGSFNPDNHGNVLSPPAYGDESSSSLALPINRLSESSNASSADHGVYATTTTTHTIHTTTTFFRLPRRKKSGHLFPLPPKVIAPEHGSSLAVPTSSGMGNASSRKLSIDSAAVKAVRGSQYSDDSARFASPLPSPSYLSTESSSVVLPAPAPSIGRNESTASGRSSPVRRLGVRSRSSTLSSIKNGPIDDPLPTPTLIASTRTSTSTGRKSFGDLFSMSHRLRQNTDPHRSSPDTPGSGTSKNNSIQLARDPIVIPERHEEDTPSKYLVRLEEAVSRGVVASVVSKGSDTFSQQVLRSYMRGFGFFGDPMDMAIRKLLMEVELPKETQQIDRCLQSFANRYAECNPGIYASPDQAYFIAFSLLILHTDVFNKNNKHKMQKQDYIKNTQGEGIFDEILECFYDNISYTPFIHVEDDIDINGERIIQHKTKKKSSLFPRGNIDPSKRPLKEPVDPYTLIIDGKLDILRPNLKEVMYLEEHYNYLGTAQSLNLQDLQKTFFRTGVLQIVSQRSRPDAFMSEKTVTNPEEAHPGIVDIKITKVGLLWRKDAKKKKTRSPWQEWGAILTGAQLYFFRNTAWVKNLMHQHETHIRQGHDGIPVIFKPPLEQFKPDALMSTDDAVALLDSTYKKHKNSFVFVRHGGFEEIFLADNEDERNDWLAKLNYAAAFRTSGVRMRGVVGGNYDGQRTRGIRRIGSASGISRSIQTPSGEVTIVSGKIDNKMAQEILAARREIMIQKISEAEEKLALLDKQLDVQLRNARHLQILAPIHPRTRDQVVLAAGRMAAKLKWLRLEIWRLRCHRDILSMDLDEERNHTGNKIADTDSTPTANKVPEKPSLARLDSSASTVHASQRTPHSPSLRPSTQPASPEEVNFGVEDFFHSPVAPRSASSFHKAQASWELPPLTFDAQSGRHPSLSSSLARSPVLSHTSSFPSIHLPAQQENTGPGATPQPDANERALLQQAGLMEMNGTSESKPAEAAVEDVKDRPEAAEKEKEKEKEKLERGKIRRSLHRTLREAHVPTHHRSRKGKDSSSSAGMSDETNTAKDDVLARGTGSFVVHGKKASVITFGEELSIMSPEERLRIKKQGHKTELGKPSKSAMEDETGSVIADPADHHEHRDSAASASTTTARSFRELHKRLSAHAATLGAPISDGDDSEAAMSFSDGRRTPLPPVEDMEEDENFGQSSRQASFYTPDAPRSPARDIDEKGKGRMERVESPPISPKGV